MLKATSNGLRQQSVARQAVIKVSCLSKILPSVVFCTTLKPNEQFSGNSVWVQQRQRRNPYGGSVISVVSLFVRFVFTCSQLCTVFRYNNWKFH